VLGTAGYMSPSRCGAWRSIRGPISSALGRFSTKCCRQAGVHGDTAADTMSSILKEEPAELSETNRNVSPALERIVHHCLEKNPESRFHSASDIAFDLEHLSGLSGATARVATAGSGASAALGQPRGRLLAGIAAGLALAGLVYGLGW